MATARPLDDLLSQSDIQGKKVFLRADLNVPVTPQGTIRDATRLDRLLPTIQELSDAGARVGILSHFGRPNGEKNAAMSLKPIAQTLSSILNKEVSFCADCIGHPAMTGMDNLAAGELTVLENTRFHPGEEANDEAFIKSLSAPADAFVNDAFSAAHRAHASTEGLARFLPSFAGRSLQKELEALEIVLGHPTRPVMAVVGGQKSPPSLIYYLTLSARSTRSSLAVAWPILLWRPKVSPLDGHYAKKACSTRFGIFCKPHKIVTAKSYYPRMLCWLKTSLTRIHL